MNPCYFPLFYSGSGVLLPAAIPNIAQWIYNYSGVLYLDKADAPQLAKPINVGVPVLSFAAGGTITAPSVIGTDTLANTGTATLTAGTGSITVGIGSVGTVSQNGTPLYYCNNETTLYDLTGGGNTGTPTGGVNSTADDIPDHLTRYGYTLDTGAYIPALIDNTLAVGTFDGVGDYVTCGAAIDIESGLELFADKVNLTVASGVKILASNGAGAAGGKRLYMQIVTKLGFGIDDDTSLNIQTFSDSPILTDGIDHDCRIWLDETYCYGEVDGVALTPIAHTKSLPFSASGFSSVGALLDTGGTALGEKFVGYMAKGGVRSGDAIDFTQAIGKTTTVIDGCTITTADLDAFWAVRYADASGSRVDADSYELIGVRGSIDGALVHNGAPSGLRFEDAYYATNAPNRFHDGINPIDIYWPEIVAHPNGEDNSYQKSEIDTVGSAGQCVLVELGQYKLDPYWMPTPSDLTKNNRYWSVCGGFSASLVPAKVTAGTGIGPNLDWADNGEGKVLLVEDA